MATLYKEDPIWDWRDHEESWIEDLILSKADILIPIWILGAMVFAGIWLVLNILLCFMFNHPMNQSGLTWEMPMDTGLIILFALCGTVLGSVAMWCVTVYKLRMAQLTERKEIRQAEVDKEMWKRIPLDQIRQKELR